AAVCSLAARLGGRPARVRAAARLPAAALRQAATQTLHEIDDFSLPRLLARLELHFLSFELALDDSHEIRAVLVGVFLRIPFRGETVHERLRHIELGFTRRRIGRELELAGVDEFVGKA